MLTGQLPVHIYACLPVNGAEVEQGLHSLALFRQVETALVPQCLVLADLSADSRERGLHCERDEYLALGAEILSLCRGYGIIPESVEVDPLAAYHLRPRVFRKRCGRIHLFGPFCLDGVTRRFPFFSRDAAAQKKCSCSGCKHFEIHIGFFFSVIVRLAQRITNIRKNSESAIFTIFATLKYIQIWPNRIS